MDFKTIALIGFAILIIFSICGWCCVKPKRTPATYTTVAVPGTVVSTTTTAPYPIQERMPMPGVPVGFVPAPNYASQPSPYPPVPLAFTPGNTCYPPANPGYPPPNTGYPPANPGYPPSNPNNAGAPGFPPYPPQAHNASQQEPPSYAEATSVYAKQSAFNPDFS